MLSMKKIARPAITIGLSLALALFSAVQTESVPASTLSNLAGIPILQTTPTPQAQDNSEMGSTDGIVLMGGVIVLIIFAPILINRKTWRP